MKKFLILVSFVFLLVLTGCNHSSENTPDNKETYEIEYMNFCNQDVYLWVGKVPYADNEYVWKDQTVGCFVDGIIIKPNESRKISGKLGEDEGFLVQVSTIDQKQGNGWGVYRKCTRVYTTNIGTTNGQLQLCAFENHKSKVENTGEENIRPLTIKNNFSEPIRISVGYISYLNSGFDWNNANYFSVLDYVLLKPYESITVYGQFTAANQQFCGNALPVRGGGFAWAWGRDKGTLIFEADPDNSTNRIKTKELSQ